MSYYLLRRLWLVRYLLLTSNIGSFEVENWVFFDCFVTVLVEQPVVRIVF